MARIIPKNVLEEIRFRNDIVDLIGAYLNLQRAGSTFRTLCPFHKEKTPSFHVNPQRQIFHCFGCGEGGDVFRFLMRHEGVDFMTAARMLAERAGVPLQLEAGEEGTSEKPGLYAIHEQIARFYQRCLQQQAPSAEAARKYLAGRALPAESIAHFMIGYAPDAWDAVLRWGEKHHVGRDLLEKCGLIVRNSRPESRSEYYDRFRNRVMFPICDEQGRVVAFSGRTMEADPRAAKYVNSPETPLFQKSRILYALDKARRPIVESREAIVCEGQIDVIRCHAGGFDRAVASQGTAFTEEHARILRRYADSVVLVFDSDTAGEDAAVKTAALFVAAGLAVRVARLPKGEDPDSFIRDRGPDAFRAVLDAALSAVGFQIRVLSTRENLATEVGAMRAAKAALETIARSPNAVQRARLIEEASDLLRLPPGALENELQRTARRGRAATAAAEVRRAGDAGPAPATRPREEVELCEHLVQAGSDLEPAALVRACLPLDTLSDSTCRELLRAALQSSQSGRPLNESLLDYDDPTGELQRLAAEVQMAPAKVTGKESTRLDAVKDIILTIWRRELIREREALEPGQRARRMEITYELNRLRTWEAGSQVIETELGTE